MGDWSVSWVLSSSSHSPVLFTAGQPSVMHISAAVERAATPWTPSAVCSGATVPFRNHESTRRQRIYRAVPVRHPGPVPGGAIGATAAASGVAHALRPSRLAGRNPNSPRGATASRLDGIGWRMRQRRLTGRRGSLCKTGASSGTPDLGRSPCRREKTIKGTLPSRNDTNTILSAS